MLIKHEAVKTCGGVTDLAPSTLDGGERRASRRGRLHANGRESGKHFTGGRVVFRGGLKAIEKEKSLALA